MDTKKDYLKLIVAAFICGFGMWVVGGLYHNLILPTVNEKMHPHHTGLGITLIAYILLGFLMTYFYNNSRNNKDSILKGIKIGAIIGVLWVLPHGLTMAAVHESSITYEISNAIYHIIEQGIGGIIIFITYGYIFSANKNRQEV